MNRLDNSPSSTPPARKSSPSWVVGFSPDDLVIVQRRQDWRLRVALICLEYFEERDESALACAGESAEEIGSLGGRYARIADYIKRDLPSLLVTCVAVHDLEAVRHQVNYFLEEIVRHLRTSLQHRSKAKAKSPLLGSTPEEIEEEVAALLDASADAPMVFVENVVMLAQFEIEVGSQRERIRLLLGGDRRLSNLGNNEAIMTVPLEELWQALDDFLGVYSYLREHLPPMLDKASPYPALEEELQVANEQLQALIRDRVDPFEERLLYRKAQDVVVRRLERLLEESRRRTEEILEVRAVPLLRQASSARGALILPAEVEKLRDALPDLGARVAKLDPRLRLPAPTAALDVRGEAGGVDVSPLERQLRIVAEETSRLPQAAIAGIGAGAFLPGRPVLEVMLREAVERLRTVHEELERALAEVQQLREAKVKPLREHFCTLMGELRTFLQTSFAHIASKDPRSTESSYHFFLREFSNEAHHAIILLKEIRDLEAFINGLGQFTVAGLPLNPDNLARILRVLFVDKDDEKKRIPSGEGWKVMSAFLEKLKNELAPRLQKVCALDGIRYEDKNFLSEWAMDLTRNCTLCLAQHDIGYGLLQEMGRLRDDPEQLATRQVHTHIVTARTCRAMQQSLTEVCMTLTASVPYVSIMKEGIERRASVFFHRQQKILEGSGHAPAEEADPEVVHAIMAQESAALPEA